MLVHKVLGIILLSLLSQLWADQEIRGSVVQGEEHYRPPVDSAIVVIKWGVWSDSVYSDQGLFKIKSPATGKHYIRAYKWIKNEFWSSKWQQVHLKSDDWKWVPLRLTKEIENSIELKE